MQFIADAKVLEHISSAYGQGDAKISGVLLFPNGTTYQIDNSDVSWIRDRNGNTIQLAYNSGAVIPVTWYLSVDAPSQITDSLGRVISINYNDTSCSPACLSVTYPGTSGSERVVKVAQTNLGSVLRSGYTLKTIDQLFPGTGQPTSYNFDPSVSQAIYLPNNTQIQFHYNSYGELARVVFPTGGAVEYDYGDGHNGSGDGFEGVTTDGNPVMIYRRLQERREYANGSSTVTSRTHYTVSYPASETADTDIAYDPNGNALAKTVHTFDGSPLDALSMNGTSCNGWNEGLEIQTDSGSPAALVTIKNTYAPQSGCLSNPELQSQTSILDDTNQFSQVTFAYDEYNNVLDKKEYDWGAGTPGALLRETQTQYQYITGLQNGVNLWMVRVPMQVTIFNGSTVIAATHYGYDETGVSDAPNVIGHDSIFGTTFNCGEI